VPPTDPLAPIRTNAMWTFRNAPTVFGEPTCDNDASCISRDVLSYDHGAGTWLRIGSLLESRRFHTVIEVPGEVLKPSLVHYLISLM